MCYKSDALWLGVVSAVTLVGWRTFLPLGDSLTLPSVWGCPRAPHPWSVSQAASFRCGPSLYWDLLGNCQPGNCLINHLLIIPVQRKCITVTVMVKHFLVYFMHNFAFNHHTHPVRSFKYPLCGWRTKKCQGNLSRLTQGVKAVWFETCLLITSCAPSLKNSQVHLYIWF